MLKRASTPTILPLRAPRLTPLLGESLAQSCTGSITGRGSDLIAESELVNYSGIYAYQVAEPKGLIHGRYGVDARRRIRSSGFPTSFATYSRQTVTES